MGKSIAIYLDGVPISEPTVNEAIKDGRAEISGNFNTDTAKSLARDLNLGALPVPIKLISTQTIGATLGDDAVTKGVTAAFYGFVTIAVFLILWYRLPGVLAVVALTMYIALVLAVYKLVPVTLTSAGIAGFILSMGLAVDANVLIFERMKEELRGGKELRDAIEDGFLRAWLSIRDSNVSGLITAVILFWFGESLIEGFALTFALGVLTSMFSAIVITRVLLRASGVHKATGANKFLFGSGLN
ncbi:MAG: Protein translocase subunit SecD [Parcubacteria group bacterium GW2011_GWC1_51_35]|nr:MAG: Protein translocase subunit SecD [Parcubacteria group bacterium GW2011_GWC1_51_35]